MILYLVRLFLQGQFSPHSISTVPGFDQSPSEDERFAQAHLRFSGKCLMKLL
jgi:hypothetical protein